MQFIGIIPARYASTRFPGKPLAEIGGKPMIQRVWEQAKKALDRVVVATDDKRIYDCVKGFGGEAVMTRSDHRCGTDRCLEAFERLGVSGERLGGPRLEDTVIINIQGDEPFIQPEQIRALMACFPTEIATLVQPYSARDTLADLENPNSPKVTIAFDDEKRTVGRALLFSRSVIPYLRGIDRNEWLSRGMHYRHIGMYAYRADILGEITQLAPSPLEQAESLEQLRWLENGYTIRVAVTETRSIGIDTPEDLKKAQAFAQTIEH